MATRMSAKFAAPKPFNAKANDPPLADRPRVLIVDDDERNLLALRTVVEEVADAVTATSGEEALRHLLKDEFAVILLDVFMPGIDGYETAQIIRAREQTKSVPIVFLSAINKESAHLLRGYEMGAVDYVFKPVEPVVLKSKVAVFVDLFAKAREIQRKAAAEQKLLDANLRANAERLRVEQELRLAQQRQAAIIESLPIVLYLEPMGQGTRVPHFVSANLEAVTGYTLEEVQATPSLWSERLHPDERERVLAELRQRDRSGGFSVEYQWKCADGEYRHFLDQAVLLRDAEGNPLEYAGTLMDVTDRKLLEKQLMSAQKMDAVGKLTGGIAHDFNNLLAAVLGGLGMLERRVPFGEEHRKILAMTRHAAEQGSELVKRLLAFARRQQLQPDHVSISLLAEAVGDLLEHTLGGLVELRWDVGEDVWPAFADASQLELALMNLIINARDAMTEGGVITVAAASRQVHPGGDTTLPAGDYVVLTVRDTGSGIPPEILERVLEPFFTTKEVGKGTGLGLSMVYGFARQSGGTLQIESELGLGTQVELWLPRANSGPEIDHDRQTGGSNGSEALAALPSLKVLLVDDHDGVRTTTAAMLQDNGHQVTEASEAALALSLLSGEPDAHQIVLTDYAMPAMSGAELVRRAREARPNLPAIIITGYADIGSIANRPADVAVLGKPFTPDQLAEALRDAWARTASNRAA